jgi:DNA-binding NarL/FixJ family response regulator
VEYHRQNIREKLGLRSTAHVIRHATVHYLLGDSNAGAEPDERAA